MSSVSSSVTQQAGGSLGLREMLFQNKRTYTVKEVLKRQSHVCFNITDLCFNEQHTHITLKMLVCAISETRRVFL